MKPSEFLRLLWTDEPPGLIHLWRLKDKRSLYFKAPGFTDLYAGNRDVFCGVGLAHTDHGPRARVRNDTVIAIPGLWADIDTIGGPENRTHGARDRDQAIELAHTVLRPTILVSSGYGLQGYWLFDGVWRFRSRDEQLAAAAMSARWHELLRREAERAGWHFDVSTRDLARLLRLVGTDNGKGDTRAPVEIVDADGPRYTRDVLTAAVRDIELHSPMTGTSAAPAGASHGVGELRFCKGAAPPADRLRALLVNSPEFEQTWTRARPDFHDDQSRYDLALANLAVAAGWTDQDVATLIGAHRGWDPKSFRRDYIERTIVLAREAMKAAA